MKKQHFQWVSIVVLIAAAGWRLWVAFRPESGPSEKAWYYDLSEKKLFAADRGSIPPIRGMNDATADGVRAVVVAPAGKCDDPEARRIAYLETNAPELKQALDAARASGTEPAISRGQAQSLRLVRRVTDTEWFSLATAEGERIVSEWVVPGPDGQSPAVCTP